MYVSDRWGLYVCVLQGTKCITKSAYNQLIAASERETHWILAQIELIIFPVLKKVLQFAA